MFALTLSVWCTLLHRLTGEEDIVVGTPMACRNQLELETLVGYLINPVRSLACLSTCLTLCRWHLGPLSVARHPSCHWCNNFSRL